MKKILSILLALSIAGTYTALYSSGNAMSLLQVVKPNDDIKSLFSDEQYQQIIDHYAATPRTLSSEELTYVAHSYLMLEDIANADKYIEMALKKDTKYSRARYVKGLINVSKNNLTQAIKDFQQAIALNPNKAEHYTQLGNVYYAQENYTKSQENYKKAISLPDYCEKAYYMIGVSHASLDDVKSALEAFYTAKNKVTKDKELYVTILYNIGSLEYDAKDYAKAVEAYQELLEYFPDDYYSLEKVIQCHNSLGYFARADIAKRKLYSAYEKGELLSSSISDLFCIDYFTVGDKYIQVYERYEEPTCRQFIKNIVYISNQNGDIQSEIYLEYIPSSEEDNKGKYRFRAEKDNDQYLYNDQFEEYPKYNILRTLITDIAEGKLEPVLQAE
ncbi:MAG: tetratricopeptide repeat protein [Prevotella sp.]|jgi:tetratricopeptide (TPR) repeat protein|nr:tetratricopeptide repeat protein [Prevotella sp.]